MEVRQSIHSDHAKQLDTDGLRREFLVETIFDADQYTMVYSHIDRIIVGGVMPVQKTVTIGAEVGKQLGVSYFLERRELGIINIGGPGTITIDGECFEIGHREALYVGKGARDIVFASVNTNQPAKFFTTAHRHIPPIQPKRSRLPMHHHKRWAIQKPATAAPSINIWFQMYYKPVSYQWGSPSWLKATCGTPCHATPMNAAWKSISTSTWTMTPVFST